MAVCSADTILGGIRELATPIEEFTSTTGVKHSFNINPKLYELLLKSLLKTKQISPKTGYTLDYDNQVIPTEKYDSKKIYKKMCRLPTRSGHYWQAYLK